MKRLGRHAVGGWAIALLLLVAPAAHAVAPTPEQFPAPPGSESEPNDTAATATPIASGTRVRANITPDSDVDYYSFHATSGQRVYAAAMTDSSAWLLESSLAVIDSDGTTVVELPSRDANRATADGVVIPRDGTYYLRVKAPDGRPGDVLPYDLYFRLQGTLSSAALEAEPNDEAHPQPLPANGFVRGAVSAATSSTPADEDWFSLHLEPGDTVYAALNRSLQWPGAVEIREPGVGAPIGVGTRAAAATVNRAGTYLVRVFGGDASLGGSYKLSATVIHAQPRSCRVYSSSADTPIADATGAGPGVTTVPIQVPDDFRLGHVAVDVDADHPQLRDLDLELRTPADNDLLLLARASGFSTAGGSFRIDDDAAGPPTMATLDGTAVQPEPQGGRLAWTEGESSAGTWNLVVRDTRPGGTGTLNGWRLVLCEQPPPPATADTVYSSDFESTDGGFTNLGAGNQWGTTTLSTEPIGICASGSGCWSTGANGFTTTPTSSDLVSPPISLAGRTGPVVLSWAQRYVLDVARHNHYWVEVRPVGGGTARRVFEWAGPSMFPDRRVRCNAPCVSNPLGAESAGWGRLDADLTEFAGQTVQVVFHFDSDISGAQIGGVAIDDVAVRASGPPPSAPAVEVGGSKSQKLGPSVDVLVKCATRPECHVAASGQVLVSGVRTPYKLRGLGYRTIALDARQTLRIGVPPAVRDAVAAALRAGKTATAEIRVVVENSAGDRTVVKRRIKLHL